MSDALDEAIYFLKVPELRALSERAGLPVAGNKQALIDGLLSLANGNPRARTSAPTELSPTEARHLRSSYPADTHLVPGHYANNRVHRERFEALIGPHFSYTIYGMDWIRAQWAGGTCPTYAAFAAYWQAEFERRRAGGTFASKRTLQRVRFFRARGKSGLGKAELEAAWKAERARMAAAATALLDECIGGRG